MKYTLLLSLITSFIFSQNKDKIQFNYLSFGTGIYTQQHYKNGITGNIDLSLKYKKNLMVLFTSFGFGGNDKKSIFIFDNFNSFAELDLLYGKEFEITNWLKVEGQIGVGIFTYNNSIVEESKNAIGFPFRAKFLLYPSKKFGIGFNPNLNVNVLTISLLIT